MSLDQPAIIQFAIILMRLLGILADSVSTFAKLEHRHWIIYYGNLNLCIRRPELELDTREEFDQWNGCA